MCTTHDSHPPIKPISGAAINAQSTTLTGEDGAEFRVYHASPEQGTGAGIVILPDVRGLHTFFEELAMRYAAGSDAAAVADAAFARYAREASNFAGGRARERHERPS